MELEERLKPTWMFERCAETFDFSRPKVPIKLHRPLALCLHTNEWQIAVEISNFINSKVRLNLSPQLRISYLESWHHWDFFPEGIFGFRQIVPPQGCLWRSKSFTNYRQGCSFGTTLEIRSSLSSDFGRLAVRISFLFFQGSFVVRSSQGWRHAPWQQIVHAFALKIGPVELTLCICCILLHSGSHRIICRDRN
jgi:hypothetical protein